MKTKSLIFAVTFILSLALLSCAYASDANETVIADDQSIIESNIVCENKIADVSLSLSDNVIIFEEENPTDGFVIDNNGTTSFEIVNNIKYDEEECDLNTEKSEKDICIDFSNNSKFCDINLESDEKLDATFNNNISITSFFELNISLDDVACFDILLIKMEDFDSTSFKEGKYKNSFPVKLELIVYVLHDNNFENYLDSYIVICSNKLTDNFAYSINNSIIGDESSIIYSIFNSSYFINQNYLFSYYNSYFFSVLIFSHVLSEVIINW